MSEYSREWYMNEMMEKNGYNKRGIVNEQDDRECPFGDIKGNCFTGSDCGCNPPVTGRTSESGQSHILPATGQKTLQNVQINREQPRQTGNSDSDSGEYIYSPEHAQNDAFRDALSEMASLHDKKGADYGTNSDPYANVRAVQEFGIDPWLGAILKCSDKMSRIKAFATRGSLENEGIEDALIDNAVYAVIALVLWREEASRCTQ